METTKINLMEPFNIEGMSYRQLRKNDGRTLESWVIIKGDPSNWYIGHYHKILHFVGRRHFTKTEKVISITYKKGKWYGNNPRELPLSSTEHLLRFFGSRTEWCINFLERIFGRDPMMSKYVQSKSILPKIIKGSITSEEGLYKAVLKYVFKLNISWRAFKAYTNSNCLVGCSLYDIVDFTTNPEAFINESINDHSKRSLLRDTLKYARDFDERINPLWSLKRLQSEHQKQIIRQNLIEIEAKDNKPIYTNSTVGWMGLIDVIDTEQKAFIKGMEFSNCVHSCYWRKIKNYEYIAFTTRCQGQSLMVGLRVLNGEISIDQVFRPYNNYPSDEEMKFVKDLIAFHAKALLFLIKSNKPDAHPIVFPPMDDDEITLPF